MKIIDKIKKYFEDKQEAKDKAQFEKDLQENIDNGNFKKFDPVFYAKFNGMYHNGLPIYYILKSMSYDRAYENSAILASALGEGSIVCTGWLSR